MKKFVVYIRVSTRKQGSSGLGLEFNKRFVVTLSMRMMAKKSQSSRMLKVVHIVIEKVYQMLWPIARKTIAPWSSLNLTAWHVMLSFALRL